MAGASSSSGSGEHLFDELVKLLAPPALVFAAALSAGASAAGLLGRRHRLLPFDPPAALKALAHFHHPAVAWPAALQPAVPGEMVYWLVTGAVVVLALAGLAAAWLAWELRRSRPRRAAGSGLVSGQVESDREIAKALSPRAARRRVPGDW